MATNAKRFLVRLEHDGPDKKAAATAVALVLEACKLSQRPLDVVLFLPTRHNLDGSTVGDILGQNVTTALLKGRPVRLDGQSRLRLETERTFNSYKKVDVIVVAYPTRSMLDKVDDTLEVDIVIVLPWRMEEIQHWVETWNPIVPGEERSEQPPLIDNPVVEEGMRRLTKRINLSTGLGHPSDRDAAIHLFRILVASEELYDPSKLRAWALREGWAPRHADVLAKIAESALKRGRMRAGPMNWATDTIEQLRKGSETRKK